MVRSLGWARAAALIGVIAEASRIAPTSAARSRRFQGARLRYSRSTCTGSWCGAPVTPRRLAVHDEDRARMLAHETDARALAGVRNLRTTRASASSGLSDSRISPAVRPR